MQSRSLKLKNSIFELWFLFFSFQLLVILSLCGCVAVDVAEFFTPAGPPDCNEAYEGYYKTELKTSNSADVLTMINLPEYELLSQSKSVVASVGQKKKGYKTWFKMVAFDENEMTARRKYFFVVDERPKALFVEPWEGVRFDSEVVLESEVLDEPYADENARRIAILRWVLENFRKDIDEVEQDNKTLAISGMLVNQAFEAVLVKLDSSPALATELSDEGGLGFEHISFDKGKIRMVIADDIVSIKIRLGSFTKKLKISFEEDIVEK